VPKLVFQMKSIAFRLVGSVHKRGFLNAGSLLAIGLTVSGCSMFSGAPSTILGDCLSDRIDIVENADWANALTMRVRIVDGDWRPMVMYLEKDRPYILTVENVDDSSHSLWAPRLLKEGIALESVQFGDKVPAKGCVNGLRLEPRSEAILRFVPVWEGRYEIDDSALSVIPGQRTDGVVNIVQPRTGLVAK